MKAPGGQRPDLELPAEQGDAFAHAEQAASAGEAPVELAGGRLTAAVVDALDLEPSMHTAQPMVACAPLPACLRVLVSASCTMR